ncbi:hypothetical protein NE237_001515 [Protea cynaroides]|uniref:Anthocyanin acyltransferase n=1 Tax=Protea cynaroides TaxID=273540 RepID=A0A9Q0QYI3_9MAGN|nr:hypothetical protein NE237_001515 [Protea cynaroides]
MTPCKLVKVLQRCKISPPSGSTAPEAADIPLTFLDQLWLPFPPIENLFFYHYPYSTTHFTQFLLPRIKLSLSRALIHFYPLAGNLSWPHDSYRPIIRYVNGDFIWLTVVECDADFKCLSGDHARDTDEAHTLVPHLPTSGPIVPLMAIQVTIFPNSGISIGVIHTHSVMDGRSMDHFMRTWAMISKLGDANQYLSTPSAPFLDRTLIKDPNGFEKIYLKELEGFIGSDKLVSGNRSLRIMDIKMQPDHRKFRATFDLSPTNIRRLKDWILMLRNKDQSSHHISTFVAICAFSWVCLLKAEASVATELEESNNNMTSFGTSIDCRAPREMDPLIPPTYFGNCVKPILVTGEKSKLLREDGLIMATELIGEAIRVLGKEVSRGLEDVVSELLSMQSGRNIAAAGSPRFALYGGMDFGWGRPKKVENVSTDITGAIFLKESRKLDGGVEIDVALEKKEMDAFALAFVSQLKAAL